MSADAPVIVILGATGSGKTGLGVEVAKKLDGEVISADSRAIYKGMDIGTAKPSVAEQAGVPHWGLDLVGPGERFTAADWKAYANEKIREIQKRGKKPLVVGGTGLYIDALVYDYQFVGPTGERARGTEQENCSDRTEVKENFVLIGVKWQPEELRERLRRRVDAMFSPELFEESKKVVQMYETGSQALKSNIYEYALQYLDGELTLEEAKQKCFYADWHLAKRQLTWFKRNPQIKWLPAPEVLKFCEDL